MGAAEVTGSEVPQAQVRETALRLQQFVEQDVLRSGEKVGLDEPLLLTGRIASMGLLRLFDCVGREYGVDLLQAAEVAELRTIETLARAIVRCRRG